MLTRVHYLPVACFILLPTSFIITYIVAILYNHCEVAWPYISDTGVHVPESCIFSQLLNIAATLIGLTIAVRYKQVEQQCRDNLMPDANRLFKLNKWALFVGLTSAMGLSIVANFQELQLFYVHIVGAYLAFGCGLIYCSIQTRLSYYMFPIVKSGLSLARWRLFLTLILANTFIVSTVFAWISFRNFHGSDITNWKPEDGGYLYHLISSVCEWISALSLDFYLLTFTHEFKFMSISSPKFYMISTVANLQDEPESDESSYGVVNVVVNNSNNFASTSSRSSLRNQ